jgi:hypothetical protein
VVNVFDVLKKRLFIAGDRQQLNKKKKKIKPQAEKKENLI